jgi:hypothetical protein
LMAWHFWPKALTHQHFRDAIESARFRASPPRSALVLETFWRRPVADGEEQKK